MGVYNEGREGGWLGGGVRTSWVVAAVGVDYLLEILQNVQEWEWLWITVLI